MSATALVVTHIETEGPGHLATWLPAEGLALDVVSPWRGEALPSSLDGYAALVVMGGPHQAYDDSLPWGPQTLALLRSAVAGSLPTLGVCLGAQLLAVACGGRVEPGAAGPERGAGLVAKRDLAGADPLFWDLPLSPPVVQWHDDAVVDLPPGATLLMSGSRYPHQAFRVGSAAWGLQFHVECDAEMVGTWVAADSVDASVLARTERELEDVAEVWGEVLRRFARLAVAP
ncbi:MAG TPA: type 1 glutamine amidotransferase [Mycobacteriales bacterium]|nr:type 1 glutamine amidotransferase [Mycobacteriales bacterium]